MTFRLQLTMIALILLVLYFPANHANQAPFCFSSDVTWSSPVSGGVQSVETPEECQLLCADTNDCDSVTWYGSNASPHPDYCEMFMSPDQSQVVPCTNCTSGPESCTCSGGYTCKLDNDQLVELLFNVMDEINCAELCDQSSACQYYSWYSNEHPILTSSCALLRACVGREGSDTCMSGPSDCADTDVLGSEYPLCFKIGLTWDEDTTKGLANISSPYVCQELCDQDDECSSFTWYSTVAVPHSNFCEFFTSEDSEPSSGCADCVSALSSCTCSVSNHQTCDTSNEPVLQIIPNVISEVLCQDYCARHDTCTWYTWYSQTGAPLKFLCILQESCTEKMDCQGCFSGPANCQDTELMPLPPACLNYKELTSYTRNVITPNTNLCANNLCTDHTGHTWTQPDWAGPGWYRFIGAAGRMIAENPLPGQFCGTRFGGYMTGGHPKVSDGEVERTVYFDYNGGSHLGSINITVLNCREYFIYNLVDAYTNACGYCGV